MKILGQIKDGEFRLSKYNSMIWKKFKSDPKNDGKIIGIISRTPDSRKQRGYYHGGVLALWAFLNQMDYHDHKILEFLHDHAKKEFNGAIIRLEGKQVKIGLSTIGLLNDSDEAESGYLERVISYLEENYAIDRMKVLNPEHYKQWRDEIYSVGESDNYIDYMQEIGLLQKRDDYLHKNWRDSTMSE